MTLRIRHAIGTAAVLAVVLTLQACATDDNRPDTSPGVPATTSQPNQVASQPGPRPSGGVRACGNDDVSATVTLQPDRADGHLWGLVSLSNRSETSCRIQGHVAVSLVNAADEVVDVPTKYVDQPGPSVAVTLPPGTSAFQGIRWSPCDKAADSCGVGNTLRFSLQSSGDGPVASLSGFTDAEASGITMAALQIGTLQPSRQGVVAW
ncbi:DUF4232 domain-containing protein [Paractinoplanes hotanensis]|uniref:DUF4232 domain-containing protein n=1 Tax=Paractinoplanes hotanensis TaxID=2906497 RepID=A0ABT0YDL4_9ACTN|nr:DUF4232 domain-containing protein [Actinoplanes hotanensis]MCM4083598.1 DUF4232 domain-containing protein [Actinoplanes hotanensis]